MKKIILLIIGALMYSSLWSQGSITDVVEDWALKSVVMNANFDTTFKKTTSWTTPEIYGAVGDGVTDDASAINQAITYINGLGGGVVLLSNKNYLIGSYINLSNTNNVRLVGVGNASRITRGFTSAVVSVAFGNTDLCGIENLYIDQDLQSSGAAISISNSTNFTLKNVTVNDSYGSPIIIYSSQNVLIDAATILNSQFSSSGNHGIDIDLYDYDSEIVEDVKIINSYIQNEGHQCLKIENAKNVTIDNCTFYGNMFAADDDKRKANVRNVKVSKCTFYPNQDLVNGISGVTLGSYIRDGNFDVLNCNFDSSGVYGIGEASDSLYTVDITHSTTLNNIEIEGIEIGTDRDDIATGAKVGDILTIGTKFTLSGATGFMQTYMIDSIKNDSTITAIILNEAPSQITGLTGVYVLLNRENYYTVNVSNNIINDVYIGSSALIGGVHLRKASPIISENIIKNTKYLETYSSSGIVLYECNDGSVSKNRIFNNPFASIYINLCNRITVDNNYRVEASDYGIFTQSSNVIKSFYNNIKDINLYAFYSYPANGEIADGVEFSYNTISDCGDSINVANEGLIYIRRFDNDSKHTNLKIENNIIEASLQADGYIISLDNVDVFNISRNNITNGDNGGIYMRRLCNNGIISNNYIDSCNYGIYIAADAQGGCSFNQIIGNYLKHHNNDGIRIAPASTTTCTNNQIRDNIIDGNGVTTTGYGIRILSVYSDNNIVESNIFLNTGSTQDVGIQVYGDDNAIRFNDLTSAGTTKLDDQGTNTVISDNLGYP